jgi:hypothetical protein
LQVWREVDVEVWGKKKSSVKKKKKSLEEENFKNLFSS